VKRFLSLFMVTVLWLCCATSQASTVLVGKVVKVVDGDTIKVKVVGENRTLVRPDNPNTEGETDGPGFGFAPESDYRSNVEPGQVVKIRLVGIDTPESYKTRKLWRDSRKCGVSPKEMRKLGKKASKFTKALIKGKMVEVSIYGRDRYGRPLGIVKVDGKNVNAILLRRGMACVWRKTKPESLRDHLDQEMFQARRTSKGFWGSNPEVMECLRRVR